MVGMNLSTEVQKDLTSNFLHDTTQFISQTSLPRKTETICPGIEAEAIEADILIMYIHLGRGISGPCCHLLILMSPKRFIFSGPWLLMIKTENC